MKSQNEGSMKQTRRGFFGLLGKLTAVGAAMGVAPQLLKPVQEAFDVGRGDFTLMVWYKWGEADGVYIDGVKAKGVSPEGSIPIPLDGKHHHVLTVTREKPAPPVGELSDCQFYTRRLSADEIKSAWDGHGMEDAKC